MRQDCINGKALLGRNWWGRVGYGARGPPRAPRPQCRAHQQRRALCAPPKRNAKVMKPPTDKQRPIPLYLPQDLLTRTTRHAPPVHAPCGQYAPLYINIFFFYMFKRVQW